MKYLLLDIDGVYNPYLAFDLLERGFSTYESGWIKWTIDLKNHAAWLKEVEDKVNIVWASSWGKDSNELALAFGLTKTDLPHISLSSPPKDETINWKLPSIQKWLQQHTTNQDLVVWIDDEVIDSNINKAILPSYVKIITPDPRVGLTRQEWDKALAFLNIKQS